MYVCVYIYTQTILSGKRLPHVAKSFHLAKFCQMSGSSGKIPHLAKFCRISGKTRLLPDIWQKPTHLAKCCQMGFCMIRGVNHW